MPRRRAEAPDLFALDEAILASSSKWTHNVFTDGKIVEGDIHVPDDGSGLDRRRGTLEASWPDGFLYYEIDSAFDDDEKAIIRSALADIEAQTCIRFVEDSTATDRVHVIAGVGCWSYFGVQGGVQEMSLQKGGCVANYIVQHEFMHALGVYHEQSRPDRDQYVEIMWDHIKPGKEHNFVTHNTDTTSGYAYDPKSVMHYGGYDFSCVDTDNGAVDSHNDPCSDYVDNEHWCGNYETNDFNSMTMCCVCGGGRNDEPTIVSKTDPGMTFGNHDGATDMDFAQLRVMYGCHDDAYELRYRDEQQTCSTSSYVGLGCEACSEEECKAQCSADHECNAVFYIPSLQNCWMHSACDATRTPVYEGNTWVRTAVEPMTIVLWGAAGSEEVTITAGDYIVTETLSVEAKHFTFDKPADGKFYVTFANDDGVRDIFLMADFAYNAVFASSWDEWNCGAADENVRCAYVRGDYGVGILAWGGEYEYTIIESRYVWSSDIPGLLEGKKCEDIGMRTITTASECLKAGRAVTSEFAREWLGGAEYELATHSTDPLFDRPHGCTLNEGHFSAESGRAPLQFFEHATATCSSLNYECICAMDDAAVVVTSGGSTPCEDAGLADVWDAEECVFLAKTLGLASANSALSTQAAAYGQNENDRPRGCRVQTFGPAAWINERESPAGEASEVHRVICKNTGRELKSYWKAAGKPGSSAPPSEIASEVTGKAHVRCCSFAGDLCTSDHGDGCHVDKLHYEAEAICDARGQRLCTVEELGDGLCMGTGCGFDNTLIWTSTEAALRR